MADIDEQHEEKARDGGWVPLEEWDGEATDWVDARQFNVKGELMGRIQSQTKQLKSRETKIDNLEVAIRSLQETSVRQVEAQYNKAMQDLKGQKVEAIEQGNAQDVMNADDAIEELKEAKKEIDASTKPEGEEGGEGTALPEGFSEAFEEFVEKHDWYNQNRAMTVSANAEGDRLVQEGELTVKQMFKAIEKYVKTEFPHKFKTVKPGGPDDGDDTNTPANRNKGSKFTRRDLSEEELKVAKTIVDTGALTMQQYVDKYAEGGGFTGDRI
tara:strand:- start:932 stop:1741 length:810 start_codon:yes stop_codon:yes gene_type:complete